ncbi:uncharacterized protein [Odocoileus virginianus]|uniref:Uncharacterized protein n=1 Tax=Odocoileus virginianus TaxID=9874 RepID=A0ABM4HD37_ODOVR
MEDNRRGQGVTSDRRSRNDAPEGWLHQASWGQMKALDFILNAKESSFQEGKEQGASARQTALVCRGEGPRASHGWAAGPGRRIRVRAGGFGFPAAEGAWRCRPGPRARAPGGEAGSASSGHRHVFPAAAAVARAEISHTKSTSAYYEEIRVDLTQLRSKRGCISLEWMCSGSTWSSLTRRIIPSGSPLAVGIIQVAFPGSQFAETTEATVLGS